MQYRLSITPEHIFKLVKNNPDAQKQKPRDVTETDVLSAPQPTPIEQMAAKYRAILDQVTRAIADADLKSGDCKVELPETVIEIVIHCRVKALAPIEKILIGIVGRENFSVTGLSPVPERPVAPQPAHEDYYKPGLQSFPSHKPFVIDDGSGGWELHSGYGDDFQPVET